MDRLLKLHLSGNDSFWPDPAWVEKEAGKSFCEHCRNVYHNVGAVDACVVNPKRSTDLDAIGFECGGSMIMSRRMMALAGRQQITQTAKIGKLFARSGVESDTHVTVTASSSDIVIRGSPESVVGICQKCERILYSPVGPAYVLREQLPQEPMFFSFLNLFCTCEYYNDCLAPAKLNRIEVQEISVLSEPVDGLPKSNSGMTEVLMASGKFK